MSIIRGSWYVVRWPTPRVLCRCLHGPRQLKEDVGDTPQKKRSGGRSPDAKTPRFVDQDVATDVARALKGRLVHKPVFECCPGDGLLSQELLAAGVRNLVLWEPQAKYWEQLENLKSQHKEVALEKKSFFRTKGLQKDEAVYLQSKEHPWNKGVQLQVVGAVHHKDISMWMARNAFAMASGTFPHHRGRANLFLLVSGREHQLMVDQDGAVGGMVGPVPRRVIDYQLYYKVNTLLKIPKSAFSGELDHGNVPKTASWDRDHVYLVELTPRPDLFTAVCDKHTFASFLTFNQQLFRVRRAPLIPRLEHWCPGLGLVAIDLGYSMIDTVKQLQAQHLPVVFKELQLRGGLEAFSIATHEDLPSESMHSDKISVQEGTRELTQDEDVSPEQTERKLRAAKKSKDRLKESINEFEVKFSDNPTSLPSSIQKPSENFKGNLDETNPALRDARKKSDKTSKPRKGKNSPEGYQNQKVAWFDAPQTETVSPKPLSLGETGPTEDEAHIVAVPVVDDLKVGLKTADNSGINIVNSQNVLGQAEHTSTIDTGVTDIEKLLVDSQEEVKHRATETDTYNNGESNLVNPVQEVTKESDTLTLDAAETHSVGPDPVTRQEGNLNQPEQLLKSQTVGYMIKETLTSEATQTGGPSPVGGSMDVDRDDNSKTESPSEAVQTDEQPGTPASNPGKQSWWKKMFGR